MKTPDYYFIISGTDADWREWRQAFMKCCDLEGRLDREFKSVSEFRVYIGPHDKWVIYRQLVPGQSKKLRGIGPFVITPVGSYQERWSQDELGLISHLSLASITK